MDQNLFKRLYQRVAGFFSALFGAKSHEAQGRNEAEHSANGGNGDHNQGESSFKRETKAVSGLPGLDLSLFHKIDTVTGHGDEAFPGADVTVHYTGWLIDESAPDLKGQKFDSSVDRGQTFNFPLGQGHVIRGWDEGFAGMRIGGKRTLLIPPEMGYGARGAGGVIPPNATLMFEVELFGVN